MRDQRGAISPFQAAMLTVATVVAVGVLVAIYLGLVVNAGTDESKAETARVARCSFQFTAYRAQYSGQTNTAIRPIAGLDPYAGLKLPPPEAIAKHLPENCQKYLIPFLEASKENP